MATHPLRLRKLEKRARVAAVIGAAMDRGLSVEWLSEEMKVSRQGIYGWLRMESFDADREPDLVDALVRSGKFTSGQTDLLQFLRLERDDFVLSEIHIPSETRRFTWSPPSDDGSRAGGDAQVRLPYAVFSPPITGHKVA